MQPHEKTRTIRIPADVLENMRARARQHTRSLNGELLMARRDGVTRYKQKEEQGLKPLNVKCCSWLFLQSSTRLQTYEDSAR